MKPIVIKLVFGLSLLFIGVAFALFYIHLAGIGNFIIVGHDSFRSINFLGDVNDVQGILIAGLAINIINIFLAFSLYKRERFLASLLPFFTAFVSLLILVAVGVIIAFN